jgi:hypothetical protein
VAAVTVTVVVAVATAARAAIAAEPRDREHRKTVRQEGERKAFRLDLQPEILPVFPLIPSLAELRRCGGSGR